MRYLLPAARCMVREGAWKRESCACVAPQHRWPPLRTRSVKSCAAATALKGSKWRSGSMWVLSLYVWYFGTVVCRHWYWCIIWNSFIYFFLFHRICEFPLQFRNQIPENKAGANESSRLVGTRGYVCWRYSRYRNLPSLRGISLRST